MSRHACHTLIISVALLTALGVVATHAPVVARMATVHDGLREAPLEGKTFRVLIVDTSSVCVGEELDTWEFQRGGTLVGHLISASTWTQPTRVGWSASGFLTSGCVPFELKGFSFGRFIFASGFIFGAEILMVVGIRR
jgi:hypothetical protein